jgi:3-deoxy-D-manno-octulosonic-acid transferase
MSAVVFLLYQVAAGVAALLAALYLMLFRPRELRDRMGGGEEGATGGGIWIHAASLGEFEAAWPVARACGWDRDPEGMLVTCTNAAARDRLKKSLPPGARAQIAPLDFWPCVRRALARERPRAILFVETEIWPAWIVAAAGQGIPLALVSARISDSTFPRYRRMKRFLGPLLARFAAIGCRGEEERRRWLAIGAREDRCFVWGNTKYQVGGTAAPIGRLPGELFLLAAGSVRPGEEGILDAACRLRDRGARLILTPRHLDTIPFWERECWTRGLDCRRLSLTGLDLLGGLSGVGSALRAGDPGLPAVLIVDGMGLLNEVYGIAHAAFVGGTWVPLGGHNLFEPARQGIPVLFGPSLSGVREAAEALISLGGGVEVRGPDDLATAIEAMIGDEAARAKTGREARRAAELLAGGVEKTVEGLRALGFSGACRK